MELTVTVNQHRFLKQLADATGAVLLQSLKKTAAADRDRLVRDGMVEVGKENGEMTFAVTEKGRAWLAAHREIPKTLPQPTFPTAKQRLFLLHLAFMASDAPAAGVAKLLKPAERAPLVKEKWIETQKQSRAIRFTLTDAGWKWVEEHLADQTVGGGLASTVFNDVLSRVHTYLSASGLRLADLIRAKPVTASAGPADVERSNGLTRATSGANPEGQVTGDADMQNARFDEDAPKPSATASTDLAGPIRDACLRLGNGDIRHHVKLADLRSVLDRWDRQAIDCALLELALSGRIVLVGMGDPQEIQPRDRQAELRTPSGEPRHLVYWTGS